MGWFVHGAVFNAGGYFRTELQTLVCGSFSVSLSSLMLDLMLDFWGCSQYRGFLKIGVPLRCLYYFHTKVCSHMASAGDLYHVGPSKLICETNQWAGPCLMQVLAEGYSEHTMILHLCGSGKCTSVLCFSIRGGDARSLPHLALGVWRVSWRVFWCAGSSPGWDVFLTLVQMRFNDVKKIP